MRHTLVGLLALLALPAAWGSAACPAPNEVTEQHLYGQWRAELEGGKTASLQLRRHAELAQSVSGEVQRGSERAQLAGDVDDGELLLEESADGQRISAVWSGKVVDGSCGKEIKGTWNDHRSSARHPFVLRKTPGWQ